MGANQSEEKLSAGDLMTGELLLFIITILGPGIIVASIMFFCNYNRDGLGPEQDQGSDA
jgi:hypothetical protein